MPDYQTPGVYIEEQVAGGPIAGVGTSTAAFLGPAASGPTSTPTLVTNLSRFRETFEDPSAATSAPGYLSMAVRGFFENGGTAAYIVRIGTGAHAFLDLSDSASPAGTALRVRAKREGVAGNEITVEVKDDEPGRFGLVVTGPAAHQPESFTGLSMDPAAPGYVRDRVVSELVEVTLPEVPRPGPPKKAAATALTGGVDDRFDQVDTDGWAAALDALRKVDDVSLVAAPGETRETIQPLLVAHCEQDTKDRIAILDAGPDAGLDEVLTQSAKVESARGYAALYYPWLRVAGAGDTVLVPPSGHVAGMFARVDAERGVHKAPANELLTGPLGLAQVLDDGEQAKLNAAGVNVLRVFAGRSRPVVWGARTTSKDTAWRYVNVRRLFLFLEESIQEGIRWAVFEPNDLSLWKRLERTITEFLTRVWSAGALFGATSAEAFYVKIDSENNPPAVRDLGQVVIEVGVAPVSPAEFVVVRIGIWPGGTQIEEN